jgi:hypothetical protein
MPRRRVALLLALACDVVLAGALFAGPLSGARVLYFRDILVTYFPDYVYVARWLAHGIWPLWHADADAGAPFLAAYPVDLVLLATGGARFALAVSPPLHIALAMFGARRLALRLGTGIPGAWLSGLGYGLSGIMLSGVLYPVFFAAAWMPLAVERFLRLVEAPSRRRALALAAILAVQLSTLGATVVLDTGLLALLLLPGRPSRRAWSAAVLAVVAAALLAAPVLAGVHGLMVGSARGQGFSTAAILQHGTNAAVLLEAVLPGFLGNPYSFSELGFWGQPFYPAAIPFFTSLYVGPCLLLLAACAGFRQRRLWLVVAIGVVLSLGAHTPVGPVLAHVLPFLRHPVKHVLLATLGIALLAGHGVDRIRRGWRPPLAAAVAPGALLLALAAAAGLRPGLVSRATVTLFPGSTEGLVREVVAHQWPERLAVTGSLAAGTGLVAAGAPGLAPLAVALVGLDLVSTGARLSPSTNAEFYALRPPVKDLLAIAAREPGPARWLSYGVTSAGPLHWDPRVAAHNSDVWLHYVDRQALLPRTQVLDGLQGALDIDRMGLAPEGSTITGRAASVDGFADTFGRIRLANVRWILSLWPLPEALVRWRGEAVLPEIREPLRLYEVRDFLPRAFWVPDREALGIVVHGQPPPPGARVRYESPDPHRAIVRVSSPPGLVVVLDGYHADWDATLDGRPVPIVEAPGRYRLVETPGGDRTLEFRYHARALTVGMPVFLIGLVVAAAILRGPLPSAAGRAWSPGRKRRDQRPEGPARRA